MVEKVKKVLGIKPKEKKEIPEAKPVVELSTSDKILEILSQIGTLQTKVLNLLTGEKYNDVT